ncbi:sugar phosphate isomerase/epimerase family protein [Tautonia sociabilis]|uniref:Sugar phosphate isomerase/epimerase n=1 Tax=Tautonia sociabilis TaxID=2080755 RepID=A0A432MFK9_9BACT|nr:sugar phosphate isomerase/epimerase family protein [Tautonia sociabilis]RUL84989.1 sugar phosphate isomerase/epimerase [Tautonia sociabilis]
MIPRRSFLRTAGLGLTASLSAGARPASSQEPSAEKPFRKAIKIGMAPRNLPLVERFKLIKACGFEGVDMDSPNDLPLDEVLRAQEESGLIIHGCVCSTHWASPLSHPDPEVRAKTIAGMTTAMEDCKAYGGTTVLLVPAVVNAEISYADAYQRSQAEIRTLLPKAEETGVTIAFENVWNNFLLSPLEFARYIDEFESDRVGAYFDIGNVVRYGWPEHWVTALGDRIVKLDVKEYSREIMMDEGTGKGFNVPLGEGSVDWPAVRQALDSVGYRGWATAELRGGDADYLKDIAARMDRCFGMA